MSASIRFVQKGLPKMFALRVRRFFLVALLLLGLVSFSLRADSAPIGAAPPTNAGSVSVTDSAISPASVTILAGGSVVWTNRGTRSHKIVQSRGAFSAFQLAPGHSQRQTFARPGVYPYTVDGAIKGVVVVLTGVPPKAPSPGPLRTPGPPRHFWKGTLHATSSYRTHVPCVPDHRGCGSDGVARSGPWIGTYDGTLALAEDSDGIISGQAKVAQLGCTAPPGPRPYAHDITFEVRGFNEGTGLALHIVPSSYHTDGVTCGFAYGLVDTPGGQPNSAFIKFTAPGTAKGPWHGSAELPPSPPAPFTTASFVIGYQFAFTCTDCTVQK